MALNAKVLSFSFNTGVTPTKLMGNGVVKAPNTNIENEDVMANNNKTKVM